MVDFLSTEEKSDGNDEERKKIEFSQKLSPEDAEGLPKQKRELFGFWRKAKAEGEPAAVPSQQPEARPEPAKAAVEKEPAAGPSSKEKDLLRTEDDSVGEESWLARFFGQLRQKADRGGENRKGRGDFLEVNLVKGEIVKFFDWQKNLLILLVFVFSSLAALSLLYWGISWWGANKFNVENRDYTQNYYKLNKEIKDLDGELGQVLDLKNKMDMVSFLLDRHIYWTNFFAFLEENTLSNVYFSTFAGDLSGNYSLAAATNDFNAIDAQVKKLLASPLVKNVDVSSGSISGDKGNPRVGFTLIFSVDPKIFFKK